MAAPARTPSIADVELWYHTLELPGGVVTPGWFDLRGVAGRLPWPDVRGKRCLDVGTYDGFFAFELERRGAREVIATDIPEHEDWDWAAGVRAQGPEALARIAGGKGNGFEAAHAALGSAVVKEAISAYHLTPERLGTFDVVICGSLMLHLRDPVRALEAIRSVCGGTLMSVEQVSLPLSVLARRRPVAEMVFDENRLQWWVVNASGHRRLVEIAGFEVTATTSVFAEPFGPAHPAARAGARPPLRAWRTVGSDLGRRLFAGGRGVPHAALVARPRLHAPPVKL